MKKNYNYTQHLKTLLNLKINSISREILNYTPQLYYIEKAFQDTTPKPLGSSVLYASENNSYLITAKHVFQNYDEWDIGFLLESTFYSLEGIQYKTTNNDTDIAVCKLTERLSQILIEKYSFLNVNQIEANHKYTNFIPRYLEIGFPITKSKLKKHDKTIRVEPFILLSDIKKQSNEHVFIDIPKTRKAFNNDTPIRSLPVLIGLSGSGLWHISSFYDLKFKLVAIMIEWDDKEKKYTKGTKINIVMNMIKKVEENSLPLPTHIPCSASL